MLARLIAGPVMTVVAVAASLVALRFVGTHLLHARRGPARGRHQWPLGQWDIAPGETVRPDGHRDDVLEASMESFPASDPPAISYD